MNKRNGFTLMELLCVLMVLAITTAVEIPYMIDLGTIRYELAKKELAYNIRYCQQKALFTNLNYDINIHQTYYDIILQSRICKHVELPKGTYIEFLSYNDSFYYSYDNNGVPVSSGRQGAGCTFKIKYKDKSALVTIRPVTGRILIQ